jgi:AcrR family transcriptional regulator
MIEAMSLLKRQRLTLQKKKRAKAGVSHAAASDKRHPAAKRRRRSADDLLNRIVQSAAGEFKRYGFAGTTTAAIARKADVTEAQLFRYFGSKSNLFLETIFKPLDQHFLNFIDQYKSDAGDPVSIREKRSLYTTALQRFISENAEMLTSLVVAQTYNPGTAHGVGKINSLGAYFDHGASMMKMRIPGKPKVDPRLMVRVAFVAVLGAVMFREWIFPAGLAGDEEIEEAINSFVMEGIGANSTRQN